MQSKHVDVAASLKDRLTVEEQAIVNSLALDATYCLLFSRPAVDYIRIGSFATLIDNRWGVVVDCGIFPFAALACNAGLLLACEQAGYPLKWCKHRDDCNRGEQCKFAHLSNAAKAIEPHPYFL